MRKWLLIGGAGAVVGYVAVYFALDIKPAPEAEPEQPTAATAPVEPVVLANVVDVTNLDPLLERRSDESPGVPFDTTEPSELSAPTGPPAPIPPAAEEPADQQGAAPPVDPSRAVWYGAGRLPRQLSEFPPTGAWRLHEWERSGCPIVPNDVTVGIGFYF
jgi:hypothetical protein